MGSVHQTASGWRTFVRVLTISLAVVAGMVFVGMVLCFYAEENWRGKRRWENCKRELNAKARVLDWASYQPPAIAPEQTILAEPHMKDWFTRALHYRRKGNDHFILYSFGWNETDDNGTEGSLVDLQDSEGDWVWEG